MTPRARAASTTACASLERDRERLVDHDRDAGVDRGVRERSVLAVWRGDDHQVEASCREHLGGGREHPHAVVRRAGLVSAGGVAGDDGRPTRNAGVAAISGAWNTDPARP